MTEIKCEPIIRETTYYAGDLDGELSYVRKEIDSLIEQYGEDAYFEFDNWSDDNGNKFIISFEGIETPAEAKKRIKRETIEKELKKVNAKKKEERELKEYWRLAKKYGQE